MRKIVSEFKLIFDSLGASGGVTWTLFAIISSVLSLGIGGTAITGLGFICSILFLVISAQVFYLNYKKNQQDEIRLNKKIDVHFVNFINIIKELYSSENKQNKPLNFHEYLNEITKGSGPTIQTKFIKFLVNKSQDNEAFISNQEKLTQIIDEFLDSPGLEECISPLPDNGYFNTALLHFISVFGSAAGSCSGFIGVCAGLGLITGFSALPLLAATVLGAAILLGYCASELAIQYNIEIHKVKQVYKSFKNFNEGFLVNIQKHNVNRTEQEQTQTPEHTEVTVENWRAPTPSRQLLQSLLHYREQFHQSISSSQPQNEQQISELIIAYNT